MKMQDNEENGSELETKKPQNKRKREEENENVEVVSGREDEDESRAKKSRHQLSSPSESEDMEDCKTRSGEVEDDRDQIKSGSEDEEQKMNGNGKRQMNSEDSTDEEKEGNERNCADRPKEMVKRRANTPKNEEKSRNTSQGKKTPQRDEENETDTDSKSERSDNIDGNDSSDNSEKEEKVSVEMGNNNPDSNSSLLLSAKGKWDSGTENTQDNKKKKMVKEERGGGQKDDDKAVVRLKRYIALCGVRRNYKKILDGCRSVRAQVAVLKKELEDLGVHGHPSIKKCNKVRMKREEAQELAALDVSNIIATQGRPKRRGASAWKEQHDSPSSTYLHTLNSDSDSDQEHNTHRGRRRTTDWANLQGIISDDADSD